MTDAAQGISTGAAVASMLILKLFALCLGSGSGSELRSYGCSGAFPDAAPFGSVH